MMMIIISISSSSSSSTRGYSYVRSPTRKETSYGDQIRGLFNITPPHEPQ